MRGRSPLVFDRFSNKFSINIPFCNSLVNFVAQRDPIIFTSNLGEFFYNTLVFGAPRSTFGENANFYP